MEPVRHRSPKTQNVLSNIYFKSPKKKEINVMNFNNPGIITNNKNNGVNQVNYNYNKKDYNLYEEITKAFNFITFVLKQKDNQIKELKIKIEDLERQLNEINDPNIMTFNNKELNVDNSSNEDNLNLLNNNNENTFKKSTFNYNQNKSNMLLTNEGDSNNYKQLEHDFWSTQTQKNNMNNNKNNIFNKNNKKNDNISNNSNNSNNMNMIQKIKYSTNINKINNYRDNTEMINKKNNNNINNNKYANSEIIKKQVNMNINMNINEHSREKKSINQIRKEPYHTNYNQNININKKNRNYSGRKYKNNTTDTYSGVQTEKMKIVTFEHSMSNLGKPNSKSNSFTLSDESNTFQSKNDVKNYLKEIKTKLEHEKFKKFITLIKSLIKNKNSNIKNQIVYQIKALLNDKILITKFENIMKIK